MDKKQEEELFEVLGFIKNKVADTSDRLERFEEKTEANFNAVDMRMDRIEQKLDDQIEKHKDLELRTTRLEAEVLLKK